MRVCFTENPVDLQPGSPAWRALQDRVAVEAPDILLMNEMPFGPWLAGSGGYDEKIAQQSVAVHARALDDLKQLPARIVISSRPVPAQGRLANEAFMLVAGEYRFLHQKHYFPEEPGFFEKSWFVVEQKGFAVASVDQLRIGVLLCTEVMFNEHARAYGRAGADLIVIPRASGTSHARWLTAGAMAAVASGSYVVSSNRVGVDPGGTTFGGGGFAFAPGGELLARTSVEQPVMAFDLDLETARAAKRNYPCYVPELPR